MTSGCRVRGHTVRALTDRNNPRHLGCDIGNIENLLEMSKNYGPLILYGLLRFLDIWQRQQKARKGKGVTSFGSA